MCMSREHKIMPSFVENYNHNRQTLVKRIALERWVEVGFGSTQLRLRGGGVEGSRSGNWEQGVELGRAGREWVLTTK